MKIVQIRNDNDDIKRGDNDSPLYRFDTRGILKGNTERTKEGYLKADAVLTKCGVFIYRNDDGSLRRELRHPDDVFHVDSTNSLQMIPVTNEHPDIKLLDATTSKKYSIGFTGQNVRRDGDDLMSSIMITDANSIQEIEQGKKELSCGYTLDLVREDGEFNGQKYDCRQKNIKYNHVALTKYGRAGTARLNLDSNIELTEEEAENIDTMFNKNNNNLQRSSNMIKFRIDSGEFDADPQVVLFATNLSNQLKEIKTNLDSVTTENSALKAERDTLKARLDTAEKRDVKKEISDGMKVLRVLESKARKVLGTEINLDEMDEIAISKAICEKAFPSLKDKLVNCDSKYLEVTLENAFSMLDNTSNNASFQRQTVVGNARHDSKQDDVEKSRAAYEKRITESWKAPAAK